MLRGVVGTFFWCCRCLRVCVANPWLVGDGPAAESLRNDCGRLLVVGGGGKVAAIQALPLAAAYVLGLGFELASAPSCLQEKQGHIK